MLFDKRRYEAASAGVMSRSVIAGLLHLALQKFSRCVHDQPTATDFDRTDLTFVDEFLDHGSAQSGGDTEVANVHGGHLRGSYGVA